MIVMALFALFGTDLWEACGPPPMHLDPIIYTISTLVFIFFCLELILLVVCKKGYMLSFFFWLDLLAVISLVPDVLMLFKVDLFLLLGAGEGGLTIARTARAARAGARSVRIVRSMKFLSLLQRARRGRSNEYDNSKIGGRLASGVTQKMIIVIGFMLFATSMLDILGSATDTELEVAVTTLFKLHQRLPNLTTNTTSQAHAPTDASPLQASCSSIGEAPNPRCDFNRYLRSAIVDLNGDFGGLCKRQNFKTEREWRACRTTHFDLYYDMDTYTFYGDCQKQVLRYLGIGMMDIFCNLEASEGLRTFPPEKIDVCRVHDPQSGGRPCLHEEISKRRNNPDSTRIIIEDVSSARRQALLLLPRTLTPTNLPLCLPHNSLTRHSPPPGRHKSLAGGICDPPPQLFGL
jgi:hypothetical protein